jgi:hypothetical protein
VYKRQEHALQPLLQTYAMVQNQDTQGRQRSTRTPVQIRK